MRICDKCKIVDRNLFGNFETNLEFCKSCEKEFQEIKDKIQKDTHNDYVIRLTKNITEWLGFIPTMEEDI